MKLKEKLAISYIRTKFKVLSHISKRKTAEQAFQLFCTPLIKSTGKNRTVFNWAHRVSFNMNGLTVNGYQWNKDAPHKILILHGFGSTASNFHVYIEAMLEKGYQVLAFDAPAHGSSEGRTINAKEYSQMIEKVIELYGPVNGFIAHSFGGIALSLAMEKIPHDENTRIVFIAPATETTTAIDSAFKLLQINDKVIRAEFDQIIFEKGGYPVKWYSIKRAMKNIAANILWIHDEDDDVTPFADALKVKEVGFKNIEFIITKGLGHRNIYRNKSVQKKVTDFL
jgi:alpha-beta hydrolase superfamily lysophospholipase